MNSLRGEIEPVSLAIIFPLTRQALLPLWPRIGVDRTITVITFKINASPCGFDRPVTEYFKDQILSRLVHSGIGNLTVIIERDPRHELVLRFEGPEEEVTKAKATFEENGGISYSEGEGSAVV
jgi:hypothetical protein